MRSLVNFVSETVGSAYVGPSQWCLGVLVSGTNQGMQWTYLDAIGPDDEMIGIPVIIVEMVEAALVGGISCVAVKGDD